MSAFYNVDQPPFFNMSSTARAIAAANNGLLFDPSDLSTLYQDAAGTIPVTAVEQPVGLVLDKSQGLMLGPELVSNGTFDTLTGWTPNKASLSVIAGELAVTNMTGAPDEQAEYDLTSAVTPNKSYLIQLNGRQGTATVPASALFETDLIGLGNIIIVGANRYSAILKTPARYSFVKLRLRTQGAAGGVSYFDNISVRELYGNHATQSVTASRPTLSARKNVLLATDTLATQSITSIAAQYTLSFTGTGSVTLSGTATGTLTGTGASDRVSLTVTPTAGMLTLTVSGSVTKAQLELGAVTGPYQRVNTATDYDTDERYFPKYLRFDGVDDYLNLPYMGLYAGGSASIICARNAVSQSTDTYIISERSTTDADPKYFPSRQLANGGNMDAYISDDAAAVVLDTVGSAFGGAADKVIRSVVDTGSNIKLYKNGVLAADDNYTRAGTLTLNNTKIGASVSTTTSNYASMKLYGLIVTKSALTDVQRIACERHLSRKAGVAL